MEANSNLYHYLQKHWGGGGAAGAGAGAQGSQSGNVFEWNGAKGHRSDPKRLPPTVSHVKGTGNVASSQRV